MKQIYFAACVVLFALTAGAFVTKEQLTLSEAVPSMTRTIAYNVNSPIETSCPDAFSDTRIDRFTVEVPNGKTANVTITRISGIWSLQTCRSYLVLTRGSKDIGVFEDGPRTFSLESKGTFSMSVTAVMKGYFSGVSYRLYRSASASFTYRVDVEYAGKAIAPAPTPVAPPAAVKKSDLVPFKPSGWAAPLTIAKAKKGTSSKADKFKENDTLYVNWAVKCATKDISNTFRTVLYVDGKSVATWRTDSLKADYYVSGTDYQIGNLSPGLHTITVGADTTGAIDESSETNNTYSRTIRVEEDMSQYLVDVTVSFLPGGGTGTMKSVKKKVDVSKPLASYKFPACSFKRPGYVFVGWAIVYTACGIFEEAPVCPAGYEYVDLCGDLTLEAIWQEDVLELDVDPGVSSAVYSQGEPFAIDIGVNSTTAAKLTAKGLPKGVKLVSRPVTNTVDKVDPVTSINYRESTVCNEWKVEGTGGDPGAYEVTISAVSASIKNPVAKSFILNFANVESEYLPGLDPEPGAYNLFVGVKADDFLDLATEGGYSISSISGLPAGLKYDSKNGTISGVPSKSGAYTVKITAKNGSRSTLATVSMVVSPLPPWVPGAFSGLVTLPGYIENEDAGNSDAYALASATVGVNGKISGKFSWQGRSWTFSASCFDEASPDIVWTFDDKGQAYSYEDGSVTNFVARVIAKSGSAKRACALVVSAVDGTPEGLANSTMLIYDEDDEPSETAIPDIELYRNLAKEKSTAGAVKKELSAIAGHYNAVIYDGGWLTADVADTGDVKVALKLGDGTKYSGSTPLLCDKNVTEGYGGWFFVVYTAPSAYKGGMYAAKVSIAEDGQINSEESVWFNNSPTACDAYGEGLVLGGDLYGSRYDETMSLRDVFGDALLVVDPGQVMLPITYKYSEYDDELRRKVTTSEFELVDPSCIEGETGDGIVFYVNDNGTGFAIPQATKPVYDGEKEEWTYCGANDAAFTLSVGKNGLVKGTVSHWFDYSSSYDDVTQKETVVHTSKKVSFDGVLIQDQMSIFCVYPWDAASTYIDDRTDAEKQYKYKLPAMLSVAPLSVE